MKKKGYKRWQFAYEKECRISKFEDRRTNKTDCTSNFNSNKFLFKIEYML